MLPIGEANQLRYATLALDVELAVSSELKFLQLLLDLRGWAENSEGNAILLGPSL